jgi:short-subunit dehydrogenase
VKIIGKTIVITGAGSGIGKELTLQLERNNHLILLGRDKDKLEIVKQNCSNASSCSTVICDLSNLTSINAAINEIYNQFDHIDYVFNNAGISASVPFMKQEDTKIQNMIDTNVTGTILFTKKCLPLLLPNQGSIINVGSMFGDIAHPLYAVYSASKFAIRGFSDALRREYAHQGLQVFYVAPRATQTPALENTSNYANYFKMNIDTAKAVATYIIQSMENNNRQIYPKSIERLFVWIQKIFPSLIDKNLGGIAKEIYLNEK